jgi:hypothetical protein
MFATGLEVIPPLGFEDKPGLDFGQGKFPRANTCVCAVTLPMDNNNYEEFKNNMTFGVLNTKTFGNP